jgi:hypothetical protein
MLLVAAAIFLKAPVLRHFRTNPASDGKPRELLLDLRLIRLALSWQWHILVKDH